MTGQPFSNIGLRLIDGFVRRSQQSFVVSAASGNSEPFFTHLLCVRLAAITFRQNWIVGTTNHCALLTQHVHGDFMTR